MRYGGSWRGLGVENTPVTNTRSWTELLGKPDPSAGWGFLTFFLFPYVTNGVHMIVNRSRLPRGRISMAVTQAFLCKDGSGAQRIK